MEALKKLCFSPHSWTSPLPLADICYPMWIVHLCHCRPVTLPHVPVQTNPVQIGLRSLLPVMSWPGLLRTFTGMLLGTSGWTQEKNAYDLICNAGTRGRSAPVYASAPLFNATKGAVRVTLPSQQEVSPDDWGTIRTSAPWSFRICGKKHSRSTTCMTENLHRHSEL